MAARSPAGPLIQEHGVIERMVRVLDAERRLMLERARANSEKLEDIVDFVRTYADRCHHGKEEYILFARLQAKPLVPLLAEEMQELIQEHVQARMLTGRLADGTRRYRRGDSVALGAIVAAAEELVAFYPAHIEKEERHFFGPAIGYLSDQEKAEMLVDFEEFEKNLLHAKYLEMVEEMEQALTVRA